MTLSRRPVRRPARTVTTTDGARAYLPAVTLVAATSLGACRCNGCFRTIARGAEMIVSSRNVDMTGAFDVEYCSLACRTSAVGGSL